MLLLPKKIGAFTLTRKLGTGGVAESYVGTHDAAGGKPVVVRRILPYILRDPARLAAIEGRIQDLLGVRHPFLVHVIEHVREGEEHFIVEEYIDGVNLDKVLAWCRQNQRPIPHNVFLNIATQVCNGLEALHGRTGKGSQSEHVLHLALKPGAVFITREGKVMVGSFGLTRSPTTLPHGGVTGPVPTRMEYLSPEQTHPDQKLTPASDIFSLGAILYELLTLDSLFRADSNLQTIHKVRRAEVTTQLLRAKELMPGLDKVLYRALSLNPRHRYQRAFVLREDLRGLMAGYSFATISDDTRTFATPLLEQLAAPGSLLAGAPDAPGDADSFADGESTRISADPLSTAQLSARALQDRAGREVVEEMGDSTESLALRGENDPPTVLQPEPPVASEDRDRPTVPGTDSAASAAIAAALGAPSAVPFGAQPKRGAAKNPHIQLEKAGDSPGEHTSFDPVPPNRDVRPASSGRAATPSSTAGFVAPAGKGKGDASSTSAFLFGAPTGPSEDPIAPVHLTPPRVAPPPPTLPPPPMVPTKPAPAAEPLAPAAVVGAGIAAAAVAPSAPRSTAAFTGAPSPRAPAPPPAAPPVTAPPPQVSAPPAAPPAAARPAPPAAPLPPLPPGATISRPSPGPTLSRPMPGPNVAAQPVPGHVSAPRPIPPRAPAPPPPGSGSPAPSPVAAGPVAPAAPKPAPPRAPAPPPPPVDPFADEPPPRSSTGLYFGVAAVVAMGLVLVCTGVGWGGYVWYTGSSATVAEAPAGEAASVMADAAPPQLAPIDPEQDAAAVLAGGGGAAEPVAEPAAEPPPAEVVAAAPAPSAAPTGSTTAGSTPTGSAATSSAATSTASTSSYPASTSTATRPTTTASTSSYAAPTTTSRATTTTTARTAEPARSTTTASYSAPTTTTTSRTRPTSEAVVAEPTRSSSYTAPATTRTAEPEVVAEAPALDVSIAEAPVSDLEQFVDSAKRGKLTSSDVSTLAAIGTSDPQYTRSRALLLMNAQRKGDESATRRYLDEIMALPENQYNPVYLTDYARWHVNRGDYSSALEKAQLAERYWARLPPELVFTKKAEIYEIEAAAWQGKFYKSGTDLELLDKAIHDWERYRDHVGSRSRADLQERADTQIAKLNEIKERLQ